MTMAPEPLCVVTLNTWKNEGDYAARLAAMIAGLRALAPEVLLLQEVFRTPEDAADTGRMLAEALGLALVYAPARRKHRWFRGHEQPSESRLAVLVRGAVLGETRVALPGELAGGERIALIADVQVRGRRVRAGCLHLSHLRNDDAGRVAQAGAVLLHPRWQEPADLCVLGGDFNMSPRRCIDRVVTAGIAADAPRPRSVLGDATTVRATHPLPPRGDRAGREIDGLFVWASPHGGDVRVVRAEVTMDRPIGGVWPSDHAAIVAQVEWCRAGSEA